VVLGAKFVDVVVLVKMVLVLFGILLLFLRFL
jgi:hypothetical protein